MRAILLSAALLAACANQPPSPHGDLANSEWMLANETGAASPPTLAFADDRASGFAGCNRWFATPARNGETLSFASIGLTRMMCSPSAMEAERDFVAALEGTASARIEGDQLILSDASGAEMARFRRSP
jgi:heat shock protein HslJ